MSVELSVPIDAPTEHRRSPFAAWVKKRRWFVIFVIVPTILAALYYGLFASDIYVSEARFVIKSPDQKRPQLSSLANLIQTTGLSSGQEQANEILEFVRSRDALRALEQTAGIRARFTGRGDLLSRFPGPFQDNSFENLYKYYSKMVDARLDTESGTAILTAKAFTPQDAYAINRNLLNISEAMVNRLNMRAQNRAITEAQRQVDLARVRAKQARVALAGYRNAQQLIDPAKQAVGVIEISNGLIATRATLQAQLDLMRRAAPQNPAIPTLRNQINALSVQIASQDGRVVGSNGGIASKLGGYEGLFVEQEFATESLNVASAALVQARNDAQRQQFYLERIVDANQPDMPLLPRRMLSIIVVAAVLTCLYFIGWMLIVGILEHAPED
ncbi:Wzz/FepE/Etk N-terminal domain-containing protein [Sphingomonas montana]|uniref:Wzz/FepE/Etk N-terminal domain-containing protein n=1 Tax=Sphingomonas montana TaxID=1843236 RepID=UPI00096F3182|nr:Wzz/FepE/Etk N-terminal domain-containing protein [Sphingomonas montana]